MAKKEFWFKQVCSLEMCYRKSATGLPGDTFVQIRIVAVLILDSMHEGLRGGCRGDRPNGPVNSVSERTESHTGKFRNLDSMSQPGEPGLSWDDGQY